MIIVFFKHSPTFKDAYQTQCLSNWGWLVLLRTIVNVISSNASDVHYLLTICLTVLTMNLPHFLPALLMLPLCCAPLHLTVYTVQSDVAQSDVIRLLWAKESWACQSKPWLQDKKHCIDNAWIEFLSEKYKNTYYVKK